MKTKTFFLCIVLLLSSNFAQARDGVFDTSRLASYCRTYLKYFVENSDQGIPYESLMEIGSCTGYVLGYTSAVRISKQVNPDSPICLPNGSVSTEELVRVFLNYIRKNPSEMHWGSNANLWNSFLDAYPCR